MRLCSTLTFCGNFCDVICQIGPAAGTQPAHSSSNTEWIRRCKVSGGYLVEGIGCKRSLTVA
jgi:hypothetical protein